MGWQWSFSAASSSYSSLAFSLRGYPRHRFIMNSDYTDNKSACISPSLHPWSRAVSGNATVSTLKVLQCPNYYSRNGLSWHPCCFYCPRNLTALPVNKRMSSHLVHTGGSGDVETKSPSIDCVGTGLDVECVASETDPLLSFQDGKEKQDENSDIQRTLLEWAVLVSPFFFWGTAMVAMKEVLPKTGPFFVAGFRLIPAGLLLVAFALYKGRPLPSGFTAWLSIALFGLVDAACFQGFLAQGLQRTSAGLGSVIIDSQPLTVAVLAALLFGESVGLIGAAGLVVGVIGLLLLEKIDRIT